MVCPIGLVDVADSAEARRTIPLSKATVVEPFRELAGWDRPDIYAR